MIDNMIDIHTHILPGLDDGPGEIDEALALARAALDAGSQILVATPHILNQLDKNRNMLILNTYNNFKKLLEVELPEMTLLLGSEIYFRPGLSELTGYESATINGTGRYMLVEFSLIDIPRGFDREMKSLQDRGVIPIVAHPERNASILKRPSLVGQMIEAGALIQLNSGSLTGLFGRAVKKLAQNLLKRGWVHVIASDAHDPDKRGPDLRAAVSAAANFVGVANAGRLVRDNPQIIIEGLPWSGKKNMEFITGGTR
jgi:protein-tyrosine phosphatase